MKNNVLVDNTILTINNGYVGQGGWTRKPLRSSPYDSIIYNPAAISAIRPVKVLFLLLVKTLLLLLLRLIWPSKQKYSTLLCQPIIQSSQERIKQKAYLIQKAGKERVAVALI